MDRDLPSDIHPRLSGASFSGRPKVLITRPIQQAAIDLVSQHCEVWVHPVDEAMPAEMLAQAIRDVDGVMPTGVRVGKDAIDAASKLRVIANIGVGYDNVDVEACNRRRIIVTNTPDVLTEATADLAFALILGAARRVVEGDHYVRELRWTYWQWNFLYGSEMHGKTPGLYGFGRIGQATARRGRGFGMRVLYHTRHRVSPIIEKELTAEFVDRETLMRESDFLSVHVPLSPETHYRISGPELALMKPTAFVINTARGSIIEEKALVEALRADRLAGAGLDVFEHEPQVHPALVAMKNVVLMPHVGSATAETRLRMALLAATNLLAAFDGQRPPNVVNPEVLERRMHRSRALATDIESAGLRSAPLNAAAAKRRPRCSGLEAFAGSWGEEKSRHYECFRRVGQKKRKSRREQ